MVPRRSLPVWLHIVWLVLWMGLPLAAVAQITPIEPPAGVQRISLEGRSLFWIDPTGQARVDAVARLPDTVFHLHSSRGPHEIDSQTLWVRFDVLLRDPDAHWLLDVDLPGVDRAVLYHQRPDGRWIQQQAGDSVPISQWAQAGRKPVFQLNHGDQGPVRYHLAISHQRVPFSLAVSLKSQHADAVDNERAQFLLGAYFGLAALAVMMAVANALVYRDKGFAAYSVYVLMMALAQAAFTGIGHLYLWPEHPALSNPATFCAPLLAGATGVWFVRTVTAPWQFSRTLDRLTVAFVSLLCVVGVFDAIWPTLDGFAVSNVLLLTSMVLLLSLISLSVIKGDRHGRWIALGFSPVVLGASFPLLRNWGLIESGFLTEYGVMLGSALEMPLLFYGLHRRLTELTEARARARALSITDPLTGLVLGRVLRLRLHDAIVRFRRYRHQGALMLVELVNHAAIVQQHGPEMGDRALVLAASRLRGIIRDVDTAARMGSNQFAVLVEGPLTADEASAMATQVVAHGLRPSELLPSDVSLRFHVVLAMVPDAKLNFGDNQDAYVDWMSDAALGLMAGQQKAILHLNF